MNITSKSSRQRIKLLKAFHGLPTLAAKVRFLVHLLRIVEEGKLTLLDPEGIFMVDGRFELARPGEQFAGDVWPFVEPSKCATILGCTGLSEEVLHLETCQDKTQQYVAGVMLYEALSGHKPYGRDYRRVLNPLPDELLPGLRRTVRRLIEVDPRRRFSSVREAREELERVIQ